MIKKIGFIWGLTIAILFVNIWVYTFKPVSHELLLILSNVFPVICSFIAVITLYLVFASLKSLDETKAAWLMLFIGTLLHFLGETTYGYYEVIAGLEDPFPSLADGFWLSGYLFLYGGIAYLIIGFRRAGFALGSWKEFTSIAVLTGIIFCLVTLELFIPVIKSQEVSSLEKFLNIAYPIGDLVLIFLIFILMHFTALLGKGVFSKPWKYIVAGYVFMSVGDILFSYYTWLEIYKLGSYIDLWRNAGYLLIAMGAVCQRKVIRSL